jgi:hypothetical protein
MCRNLDLWFLLFYCLLSKFIFPFFRPFSLFFLSVLLYFLLLSNWFLFLSSFIFPLLFRHYFIPISLAHVVSSLAYLNLLGTKRLRCCCCCIPFAASSAISRRLSQLVIFSSGAPVNTTKSLCLFVYVFCRMHLLTGYDAVEIDYWTIKLAKSFPERDI